MKPTLLFATLSMVLATPSVFAKTELETLRALCSEQERQIKQLEEENSRLRSDPQVKQNAPLKEAAPKPVAASLPTSSSVKTHEVKQGETFYSISRKYGISVTALAAANPKVKASALRPGQQLTLAMGASLPETKSTAKSLGSSPLTPVSTASSASSKKPSELPDTAAVPSEEPSKPSPSPENKIRAVSVDTKMTFGDFASKYGTNPERLNALNGLDLTHATVLAKGSELYVPAQP